MCSAGEGPISGEFAPATIVSAVLLVYCCIISIHPLERALDAGSILRLPFVDLGGDTGNGHMRTHSQTTGLLMLQNVLFLTLRAGVHLDSWSRCAVTPFAAGLMPYVFDKVWTMLG